MGLSFVGILAEIKAKGLRPMAPNNNRLFMSCAFGIGFPINVLVQKEV